MSKYQRFIFKDYSFDAAAGSLTLKYGYDEELEFVETYLFDFSFAAYDEAMLDRAIQNLFFIAGVSYYKAYVAPEIVVNKGTIDVQLASFLINTYQNGLGEFFYLNKLDPHSKIDFPINSDTEQVLESGNQDGILIGLGGGKDSLVSVELLREQPKVATWSLNHRAQLEPLVHAVGLPHFWVERQWDTKLLDLNKQDALNGHVPISALFAAVGSIVSILSGYKDAVVSNESSASDPTLVYQGVAINHQFSKSLDFEKAYQTITAHQFGESLRYYSLLRPFSELRIAELFSKRDFDTYAGVFSSCNRAFRHGENHLFWCGECPKCAFVYLILCPFIEADKLNTLWGGKNLLLDPLLEETYKNLLGISGDKPLDCVGEVKESRTAMRLAQEKYPELSKYSYDIPLDYNYRGWSEHSMPAEMFKILQEKIS